MMTSEERTKQDEILIVTIWKFLRTTKDSREGATRSIRCFPLLTVMSDTGEGMR
jgi:hypothetical protein